MPTLIYPDSCPDCGHSLSRSRRRGWIERVFARWFRVGVFRCHRCGSRFYSPPSVIVHARTTATDRLRQEESLSEPFPDPITIVPGGTSPLAKLTVKVAPAAKPWPASRQDWTQQALRNTPSGTPFLWTRSSTVDPDKGRSQ